MKKTQLQENIDLHKENDKHRRSEKYHHKLYKITHDDHEYTFLLWHNLSDHKELTGWYTEIFDSKGTHLYSSWNEYPMLENTKEEAKEILISYLEDSK